MSILELDRRAAILCGLETVSVSAVGERHDVVHLIAIAFSMRPAALARHYRPTVILVGHRRFAMRQLVDLLLTGRWLVGSTLRLTALRS